MKDKQGQYAVEPIGYVETDFTEKFGLPRQSGLVEALRGRIVFEKKFAQPEAFRGLENFTHIWVLWRFSASGDEWHPTVRPPRLGGNTRVGVFASRSPFRPNGIGLSCVRLDGIDFTSPDGPTLLVSGIDMLNGTPVLDIKPYIPLTDCRPEASEGYTERTKLHALAVDIPDELLCRLPQEKRQALTELLSQDPRPGYEDEPDKQYGFAYAGFEIGFKAAGGVIKVNRINKIN